MIEDRWLEPGIIFTRYSDTVTGEDLLESALAKSGDERLDSVRYILADWRPARRVEISPHDIKKLVACLKGIATICPRACNVSIINPDSAGNALAAWYKYLADDLPWRVGVFTTREEAQKCFQEIDLGKYYEPDIPLHQRIKTELIRAER